MSCIATVVIPTHSHANFLPYAIHSALAQTINDIEIFIVGDGVGDDTREVANEFVTMDSRVRFFDFPKGPRHGELHRHKVLSDASGDIVCYLSDDDLWLPGHVEAMSELLREADFAHSLPLQIMPDEDVFIWTGDASIPHYFEQMMEGINFIPLSCSAHSLDAYRRLPEGWRTTPEGTPTDLYMFQQILGQSWCRGVSGWLPTTIHFPSPERSNWTIASREAELKHFAAMVSSSRGEDWFGSASLRTLVFDRAKLEAEAVFIRREFVRLNGELGRLGGEWEGLNAAHEDLLITNNSLVADAKNLELELHKLTSSRTWRVRQRLLAIPFLVGVFRVVARVLSGREEN